MKKNLLLVMLLVLVLSLFGCQTNQAEVPAVQNKPAQADEADVPEEEEEAEDPVDISGELVVYHAGSLAVPFEEVERQFEAKYPDVDILRTSGGSSELARKITEFQDAVDVFASADYNVIDSLLIPDYADWNALFAENSMVIMYSKDSKYAEEITSENWYEILQRDKKEETEFSINGRIDEIANMGNYYEIIISSPIGKVSSMALISDFVNGSLNIGEYIYFSFKEEDLLEIYDYIIS